MTRDPTEDLQTASPGASPLETTAQRSPDAPSLATRLVDIRTSIRPTVAEIDLGALRRNVRRMRSIVGPDVQIFGVMKADAYAHGAVQVGRVLAESCDALAVSLAEEGLELRAAGITAPIVVLGAFYGAHHAEVLEEGLTPVVYDLGDIERFAAAPRRRRPRKQPPGQAAGPQRPESPVDIHLKIDTGMNRLGVGLAGLPEALDRIASHARLRLRGLCTHFACADGEDEDATVEQLARFHEGLRAVRARGMSPSVVHAANSAAAVRFPAARFDAVRPGLALYGAMPTEIVARPELEPVLSLRTRIMALHDVAPGAGVSYGARWRAARPSRIATLPIGYADGYPRHQQGAQVLVRGRRVPIVGVVCMDMLMIDVTDVPGAALGDVATLIGRDGSEQVTLDELAGHAGTINYEILCGLSKRVPRLYGGDELEKPECAHHE